MGDAAEYLHRVAGWAAREEAVLAVVLVGSHARGTAAAGSDIDLVVLVSDPVRWLADDAWVSSLGEIAVTATEHWGAVHAQRVTFADGIEVEFGFATPAWAALPLDPGTARVMQDGHRIVYDPEGLLAPAASVILAGMSDDAVKADLVRYLQRAREALLWKLDGLGEYDIRRPMTPTGTNLLGLVKHLAVVEAEYFGEVFGRPFDDPPPYFAAMDEPNIDMWATADESREELVGLYRRVWEHADATIAALPLDAPGHVPWWGERADTALHRILVHVVAETHRHAGHADVLRELIDGTVGLRPDNDNMAPGDEQWWADYRDRLEATARAAGES